MKGTCLCGAIEVIADAKNEVSLCHCSMCRKWSSGALHAVHCGPNVTFKGAEPKRYQSSDWAVKPWQPFFQAKLNCSLRA